LIVVFLVPLLSPAAKRARLLQLGTDEWYLDKIKNEYADPDDNGYVREDVGDYICKVLRGYAEADFEFLGLHLPGAPDEVQPGTEVEEEYIPARLLYKPDWLDLNPRVAKYSTYKLYHWLKNCQHWDTKVHINSTYWLNVIKTEELETESYLALAPFRKPEIVPFLTEEAQKDLDYLANQDEEASCIYLDLELKYHKVGGLNQYIEDHRPIPTYIGGNKIKIPVIQWYLSRKIEEWVALGGERLLDKGQFLAGTYRKKNFKRELYWDLWQDLDNLRAEATAVSTVATYLERTYLESKGIQRKRVQSFDTQT
jgi:hypothetical protein